VLPVFIEPFNVYYETKRMLMKNHALSRSNSASDTFADFKSASAGQVTTETLLRDIVGAGVEAKGTDIIVLDMEGVSDIADNFVVISGRSDRQVQGITNRIYDTLLLHCGTKPIAVDGLERGQWVAMDYGSVIVHIFYEANRTLYDLEGFWKKAKRGLIMPLPEGGWVSTGEWKISSAA
jgi:ribosome-associated protein